MFEKVKTKFEHFFELEEQKTCRKVLDAFSHYRLKYYGAITQQRGAFHDEGRI
jgi:hypothetical protein